MTTAFHASETISVRHTYGMRTWDDETAEYMEEWVEKEVRAAIGASPKAKGTAQYEPQGPTRLVRIRDGRGCRPARPAADGGGMGRTDRLILTGSTTARRFGTHADEQMLTQRCRPARHSPSGSRSTKLLQEDPSAGEDRDRSRRPVTDFQRAS